MSGIFLEFLGNHRKLLCVLMSAFGMMALSIGSALPENSPLTDDVATFPNPSSPRALKALRVLKRHCVRCHQGHGSPLDGTSLEPASILDLDLLLKEPGLVRPGMPDSSILYNVMVTRRMPPPLKSGGIGASQGVSASERISAQEIEAVRDWILSLDKTSGRCVEKPSLNASELAGEIDRYVSSLSTVVARTTRFISLAHMARDCVSDNQLETYRSGLTSLLNGLSWAPDIARLKAVDKAGTIFAFNLLDLGWAATSWARLSGYAGSSNRLSQELDRHTRRVLFSDTPVVSGDWLVHMISKSHVYYALLAVPSSVAGLRRKLQGVHGPFGVVKVAGLRKSKVTSKTRLIARHAFGAEGFMWEAVDPLVSPEKDGDATAWLQKPRRVLDAVHSGLGMGHEMVKQALGVRTAVVRRFLFQLPNGHMGVMLADGDGKRLNEIEVQEIFSGSRGSSGSHVVNAARDGLANLKGETFFFHRGQRVAGLGCLSCHAHGVLRFKDETSGEVREAAENIHHAPFQISGWKKQDLAVDIANDQFSFDKALRHSAGKTVKERGGFDPVQELVKRYESVLDLSRAAAEMWLGREELLSLLESYEGPLKAVARRLRQGVVSRDALNDLRLAIEPHGHKSISKPAGRYVSADFYHEPSHVAQSKNSVAARGFWRLSLWTDKANYKVGDTGVIYARPDKDCRLTLIGVDGEGFATVLFPNGFARDNLIAGGRTLAVPSGDTAYGLKFNSAGEELIVGMCAVPNVEKMPGIDHDFDLQPFTVLGNWRNHIHDTIVLVENGFATGSVARVRQRGHRRGGRRRRNMRQPKWLTLEQQPFIRAREAISITVAR